MRDRGRVDISREPGPRTNCVSLCLLRTPSSLPSPSSTTPTRNYERQTRLRYDISSGFTDIHASRRSSCGHHGDAFRQTGARQHPQRGGEKSL